MKARFFLILMFIIPLGTVCSLHAQNNIAESQWVGNNTPIKVTSFNNAKEGQYNLTLNLFTNTYNTRAKMNAVVDLNTNSIQVTEYSHFASKNKNDAIIGSGSSEVTTKSDAYCKFKLYLSNNTLYLEQIMNPGGPAGKLRLNPSSWEKMKNQGDIAQSQWVGNNTPIKVTTFNNAKEGQYALSLNLFTNTYNTRAKMNAVVDLNTNAIQVTEYSHFASKNKNDAVIGSGSSEVTTKSDAYCKFKLYLSNNTLYLEQIMNPGGPAGKLRLNPSSWETIQTTFNAENFSFDTDCEGASADEVYTCGAINIRTKGDPYPPGTTLKVKFLDRDARSEKKIKEIVQVWSKYGNVNFQFVDSGPANIRIEFDDDGAYYNKGIGKPGESDRRITKPNKHTMHFGFLGKSVDDAFIRRVVLHEFGHELGFIHEHSQADFDIPWDYAAVLCDMTKGGTSINWTKDAVIHNVFSKFNKTQTNYDQPDINSIMQYWIDNKHTIGDFEVVPKDELSMKDKQQIQAWYPGRNVSLTMPIVDYQIAIKTADESNAGTDDDIYLSIHGTESSIKDIHLNSLLKGNAFEQGDMDVITLRGNKDIGKILSVTVFMNNPIEGIFLDNWKPEYIHVSKPDAHYYFRINDWFKSAKSPKIIDSQNSDVVPYVVNINTGDYADAGTDANVSLDIIGDKGSTGAIVLNNKMSGNVFERADRDVVGFLANDVGKVKQIKISHDNSYAAAGWYLENVVVNNKGKSYNFECEAWLEKGNLSKTLNLGANRSSYSIEVKTGDYADAGTDANVYINIFGDKGQSGKIRLNSYLSGNAFERGDLDKLTIKAPDVGNVNRIEVSHDNSYAAAGWYLSNVRIKKGSQDLFFEAEDWLESGKLAKTMTPGTPGINYIVYIKTSDVSDAGTDANVFLTIHGSSGSTKEVRLNGLMSGNVFERGDNDQVTIKGKDVGTINRITIRHDNKYAAAGWHLDHVRVFKNDVSSKPIYFHAARWLEGNNLSASINAGVPKVDMEITVKTSDVSGAGTDANVYIIVYGTNGNSGEHRLNGYISGNAFESGDTDVVTLTGITDIGEITSIKIRHDNKYAGAGWHLSYITVTLPNKNPKKFNCNCWIESGKLSKILQ
jgi:hypothetical protein